MQTQNISFCDNIGLNIKSNDVKQNILDDLDEIKIIEKHHETFDKNKHDRRLTKVPHLLAVRSNGNPYYMFFTRINFTNTVVMIDKKIQMGYAYPRMIITRLMFHDDNLFDNTLLEGEMIKDNDSNWLYLISDISVHKKKSVLDMDLFKRLNLINEVLENHYVPSYHDIFNIQIKKYVPLNQAIPFHNDFVKSLKYTCRGLYFKPLYTKFRDILFNFDNQKIKSNNNKPKLKSKYNFVTNETIHNESGSNPIVPKKQMPTSIRTTIVTNDNLVNNDDDGDDGVKSFMVQKTETPDVYKLYDSNNKYIDNACIASLKTSKMLNVHFQNKSMLEKVKYECIQNKNKHLSTKWIPSRLL